MPFVLHNINIYTYRIGGRTWKLGGWGHWRSISLISPFFNRFQCLIHQNARYQFFFHLFHLLYHHHILYIIIIYYIIIYFWFPAFWCIKCWNQLKNGKVSEIDLQWWPQPSSFQVWPPILKNVKGNLHLFLILSISVY